MYYELSENVYVTDWTHSPDSHRHKPLAFTPFCGYACANGFHDRDEPECWRPESDDEEPLFEPSLLGAVR